MVADLRASRAVFAACLGMVPTSQSTTPGEGGGDSQPLGKQQKPTFMAQPATKRSFGQVPCGQNKTTIEKFCSSVPRH